MNENDMGRPDNKGTALGNEKICIRHEPENVGKMSWEKKITRHNTIIETKINRFSMGIEIGKLFSHEIIITKIEEKGGVRTRN